MKATETLTKYLEIGSRPHPQAVASTFVKGRFFSLITPFSEWPQSLQDEMEQDIYFLFPQHFHRQSINSEGRVCLCLHVENCPAKPDGGENRACVRYGRGICLEATWAQRTATGKLGVNGLSLFMGIDQEEVARRQKAASAKLVQQILSDPFTVEYLEHIGIGGTKGRDLLSKLTG